MKNRSCLWVSLLLSTFQLKVVIDEEKICRLTRPSFFLWYSYREGSAVRCHPYSWRLCLSGASCGACFWDAILLCPGLLWMIDCCRRLRLLINHTCLYPLFSSSCCLLDDHLVSWFEFFWAILYWLVSEFCLFICSLFQHASLSMLFGRRLFGFLLKNRSAALPVFSFWVWLFTLKHIFCRSSCVTLWMPYFLRNCLMLRTTRFAPPLLERL